jgi:23S rRNA pseudouridine2605 synthase
LTAEQLEAARAERMRQNGCGTVTLEDARTWIEETGLCLFLPRRQFSSSVAPSFVEAVAGRRDATPAQEHITLAEELLVRLELDGVAVRLNLLGQPGEQPDFVVASWVLPYVYALRGDRDWRRSPQLTGSRQVSPLAVQAYKLLETADTTISDLTHTLGREVTEGAVIRAITELWQQLRIIPVIAAPGQAAKWQLLRQRFQKAIAEGASTSQVTAISVLASIYLQAVIAATMEDVEIFLSSLTARSKVREVLRGLMATRQVHTIPLGHSPHFYVAGTLPEFSVTSTLQVNPAMSASAYFVRSQEEDVVEFLGSEETLIVKEPEPVAPTAQEISIQQQSAAEPPFQRPPASRSVNARKPVASGKSAAARPHFSRPAAHPRDRKPAQTSSSSSAHAKSSGNGSTSRSTSSASSSRNSKAAPSSWSQRNGRSSSARPVGKPSVTSRNGNSSNNGNHREPALTAGAKSGNSKRYDFVARPKQESKKQG